MARSFAVQFVLVFRQAPVQEHVKRSGRIPAKGNGFCWRTGPRARHEADWTKRHPWIVEAGLKKRKPLSLASIVNQHERELTM